MVKLSTNKDDALLMAYQIESTGAKLGNYAQLLFTVVEAFEAKEETESNGWALRPIAEGIMDISNECAETISMITVSDDDEAVE